MKTAGLRSRLLAGDTAFGTFIKIGSAEVVEIMGRVGFDFVVLDCEHASFGHRAIEDMVRAADAARLELVVRVGDNGKNEIGHALDAGAVGVQIPGWSSLADVEAVVREAKYFPEGSRGLSYSVRAADYGLVDKGGYVEAANNRTCIVVHVESREAVDQLEELCDVSLVDVVFIGPVDLSQSLGRPGDVQHPEVQEVVKRIFTVCSEQQKAVGVFASSAEEIRSYRQAGARYILCSTDVGMLVSGAKRIMDGVRKSGKP